MPRKVAPQPQDHDAAKHAQAFEQQQIQQLAQAIADRMERAAVSIATEELNRYFGEGEYFSDVATEFTPTFTALMNFAQSPVSISGSPPIAKTRGLGGGSTVDVASYDVD